MGILRVLRGVFAGAQLALLLHPLHQRLVAEGGGRAVRLRARGHVHRDAAAVPHGLERLVIESLVVPGGDDRRVRAAREFRRAQDRLRLAQLVAVLLLGQLRPGEIVLVLVDVPVMLIEITGPLVHERLLRVVRPEAVVGDAGQAADVVGVGVGREDEVQVPHAEGLHHVAGQVLAVLARSLAGQGVPVGAGVDGAVGVLDRGLHAVSAVDQAPVPVGLDQDAVPAQEIGGDVEEVDAGAHVRILFLGRRRGRADGKQGKQQRRREQQEHPASLLHLIPHLRTIRCVSSSYSFTTGRGGLATGSPRFCFVSALFLVLSAHVCYNSLL